MRKNIGIVIGIALAGLGAYFALGANTAPAQTSGNAQEGKPASDFTITTILK